MGFLFPGAVVAQLVLTVLYIWRLAHIPPDRRPGPPEWSHNLIITSETLAIQGPEFSSLAPCGAVYCCPRCSSTENVELQQYVHAPTNKVICILDHICPDPSNDGERVTDAIPEWTTMGDVA